MVFGRTKHCIGMCTLYSIVCVQKTLSVQCSASHGASILLPFLRLEDRWWRGDGRMLRATACGGPERVFKTCPDGCLSSWSHGSYGCLNENHTKSRLSTFQNEGERGPWAPTPNWRAMHWWFSRRGRVSFLLGHVSWKVGQPYSRGCSQTRQYIGCMAWTMINIHSMCVWNSQKLVKILHLKGTQWTLRKLIISPCHI